MADPMFIVVDTSRMPHGRTIAFTASERREHDSGSTFVGVKWAGAEAPAPEGDVYFSDDWAVVDVGHVASEWRVDVRGLPC